jgi:hypothetical protein
MTGPADDDGNQDPERTPTPGSRRPGAASLPQSEPSERCARPSERDPVLPRASSDEQDVGWGDELSGYTDEWYYRERPPHHE